MSLPVVIRDAAATPRGDRFLAQRAWAANAAVQQRVGGVRELVLAKAGSEGTSGKATDRQMPRPGSYSGRRQAAPCLLVSYTASPQDVSVGLLRGSCE